MDPAVILVAAGLHDLRTTDPLPVTATRYCSGLGFRVGEV